jgi:hypothetical protein
VPRMDDLGSPSSYLALQPGVAVFASDGTRIGEVQYVLADIDDDIFDGIVIDGSALPGGLRFADAAQVAGIYERGVVLSVDAAGAEALPEPTDNPGTLVVDGLEDVDESEVKEKLRRAWETMSGKGPGKSADA